MVRGALLGLFLTCALALASSRAQAQDAQDASVAALPPAEAACAGLAPSAACASAGASDAGGVCLAGCCCHFLNDPEGTETCATCFACSDAVTLDPAFRAAPCGEDAGAIAPDDAGSVPALDAGESVPTPGSPPPETTSAGCSSTAVLPPAALPGLAFFAVAALCAALRRRR